MSNLSLCRVCLAANIRMHIVVDISLLQVFEKLTNISIILDGKSLELCYICFSHLKKCQKFMQRAVKADEWIMQVLRSGILITQQSIDMLDRQSYRLTSEFCITPMLHITTIEEVDTTNELALVKVEVPIEFDNSEAVHSKCEVPTNEVKNQDPEKDNVINGNSDNENNGLPTDSEDDMPLKDVSKQKRLEKRTKKLRVKVRKKQQGGRLNREEKGNTAAFAREIILTRDEQLEELLERAKSLNYLNAPLKCALCYKGFQDARAYDNHRDKHDEKSGPHECEICRMRYRTARKLRTHAATSHARKYACNRCPQRSHTANQAREHEKWHDGHTYECKLCGQEYRKPTSYLTHMRKHHPTQHVCDMCGDSFVGKHGLVMHKTKAHQWDHKKPEDTTEPASERFCVECNIQFISVDAWKRHILYSAKHTIANGNSPQCKICGSRFQSSTNLSAHLREHERALKAARSIPVPGTKPCAELACDQCGARFVNHSKLQAHVKRIHLGLKYNKNIVCEVCGKKCPSNASLKYHQRTHTGEKPYQCGVCSKWFTDNNQLRIHTRTHTGERPYCCAVCGKRFSQKPALNRHYRVHTGAKPYICQLCSKTFSQSNSLKGHVRSVHLKMPPTRRSKPPNPAEDCAVENVASDKNEEETVTLHAL